MMVERARECLRACLECHEACLRAVTYLQANEAAIATEHVRLLFNTAEIVRTTASLLRGDLDVAEQVARACVQMCQRSARYCDRFPDEVTMRACSAACRSCADECQLVVGAIA